MISGRGCCLELFMDSLQIGIEVERVAAEISRDYKGRVPVIIGVLNGAFIFVADLLRSLDTSLDVEVDFIQASSYGRSTVAKDEVVIKKDTALSLGGRDVIIVDDIIDRGVTLKHLMGHILAKGALSVKLCALLVRKGRSPLSPEYVGREIEGKGFIVGYGLDYKERLRNLPSIYTVKE